MILLNEFKRGSQRFNAKQQKMRICSVMRVASTIEQSYVFYIGCLCS